ncbi:MAG: T9SS type A sorting domain-containing protein [Bacteroidetes bacterium]|nr:T9SS type A sorting domain-containing protein [Bacteroidota bacterium]
MKKTILISGCYLLGLGSATIFAQQGINAAGGNASDPSGSVSYTIGQIDYLTLSGTNGTASQGVQQPFEILVEDGKDIEEINLSASLFPNPSNEILSLKVDGKKYENLSYKLFDEQGKLIDEKRITANETVLDISQLPSANYFLKVNEGAKELKTFKIIVR